MILNKLLLIAFLIFPAINLSSKDPPEDVVIRQLWINCGLTGIVSYNVFYPAQAGYRKIDNIVKKNLITIIDFSKPSTENRFYVIDLANKHLLYKCLVAHGKNSGDNYAKSFSNQSLTLKSCLGFFLTAETYIGENGYSLKLDGLEKNINDNARTREIVIHGAGYVSQEFIKKYGRLGRSWGCPALPVEITKEIIDQISGGSCLFIFGEDKYYKKKSILITKK
jgi:hypothetical protein